jgi:hypothetical protein
MSEHYNGQIKFDRCECDYHGGKSGAGYESNTAPGKVYSSATYDSNAKKEDGKTFEERKTEEFELKKTDYKKNEKGEDDKKPLNEFDKLVDNLSKEIEIKEVKKEDKAEQSSADFASQSKTEKKEMKPEKRPEEVEFDWIKQVIEATKKKSR